MRKQFLLPVLLAAVFTGCSSTTATKDSLDGDATVYRTGDLPFTYPESLLTGYNSKSCLNWSDSNIVATDKLFLFNAAGLSDSESKRLSERLDREISKLALSMDWAPYRWLDSLPVINQPNGAALFADSLVSLDRAIGTADIRVGRGMRRSGEPEEEDDISYVRQKTLKVDVADYVMPGYKQVNDWRSPAYHAYKHFMKLPRSERVESVRRYNQLADTHVGSDVFDILPGRLLVCVHRDLEKGTYAEGHDMGINLSVEASDQDVRSALVASYQSARTKAYGQLDSLVPEWFLLGQRVFHGGGRVATPQEGYYNSPINSHGAAYAQKPENYPALSGLAYRYIGEANEMSLISSLLDAVRYRDMPKVGGVEAHSQRYFREAFNKRVRGLDGGPLSLRGLDYGWNGFIGSLE